MTFPLFWLPRRRSLSSREIRFERHDERAARAVELLPQPQPPLVAMELPEPIDPFAPEIVTVPDIPEPLSAVQEELDQMAQALVPPELPEPAFEIPPLDVPPLDVPPLDRPELAAPALDAVALNGADFGALNPDPQPTVVARWNELALQAIRADKPVPTVITRALHLAHAAMYDTWAAFDPIAKGAYTDLRRSSLTPQRTIERAISHAAHSVLSTVFPHHSDRFDDLLEQLGFDSARHPMARFGRQVAESVLSARAEDGSNAGNGYDDPSGYASINQEGSGEFDPNRWTPLRIPNGTAVDENGIPIATDDPSTYTLQSPLTPHWGDVTPFAISDGAAFRPVAPLSWVIFRSTPTRQASRPPTMRPTGASSLRSPPSVPR